MRGLNFRVLPIRYTWLERGGQASVKEGAFSHFRYWIGELFDIPRKHINGDPLPPVPSSLSVFLS